MSYHLETARVSDLICALDDVTDLLDNHADMLPDELRVKLDTYAADLQSALEDRS